MAAPDPQFCTAHFWKKVRLFCTLGDAFWEFVADEVLERMPKHVCHPPPETNTFPQVLPLEDQQSRASK